MAGIEDPKGLNEVKTAEEARTFVDDPAISYAHKFAMQAGRNMEDSWQSLIDETNPTKALNIQALCWFIWWGSMAGNTLNSFYFGRMHCKPKEGSWFLFEIFFVLYWGFLFIIVWICGKIFSCFPQVPSCINRMLGFVLWFTAGLWIVPFGILSLLFYPFFGCIDDSKPDEESPSRDTNIAE